MMISNIGEAIGQTPLLHVPMRDGRTHLYIKLEYLNPCGSMKDRMGKSMMSELIRRDAFHRAALIVESSSGNTASALAMLSAMQGLRFRAIVDHHAAVDKIRAIMAFGAEVEFVGSTDNKLSTEIRDLRARELSGQSDCFWTEQHNNPANADGYGSLARELLDDLDGRLDVFVGAVGTGGSLCGTARVLRRTIPDLIAVGVEPEGSIIFGGSGSDYLQSGTGTPEGAEVGLVVNYDEIDEGRKVSDVDAFATCRVLARRFGILVGGSAGGAIYEAARRALNGREGTRVVVLACDAGAKYLDTIFNDEWLEGRSIRLGEREDEILSFFPRSIPMVRTAAA